MLNIKKLLTKICTDIKMCDRKELIWENPSSSNTFAGQTILNGEDLSKYSEIEIEYYPYRTLSATRKQIAFARKNEPCDVLCIVGQSSIGSGGLYCGKRSYKLTDSGIEIGNATGSASGGSFASDNANTIPAKIYGIKGGTNLS